MSWIYGSKKFDEHYINHLTNSFLNETKGITEEQKLPIYYGIDNLIKNNGNEASFKKLIITIGGTATTVPPDLKDYFVKKALSFIRNIGIATNQPVSSYTVYDYTGGSRRRTRKSKRRRKRKSYRR